MICRATLERATAKADDENRLTWGYMHLFFLHIQKTAHCYVPACLCPCKFTC